MGVVQTVGGFASGMIMFFLSYIIIAIKFAVSTVSGTAKYLFFLVNIKKMTS